MGYLRLSVVVIALLLGNSCGAGAQTVITLLAPMPMKASLEKLIPEFESKTGFKVETTLAVGSRDSEPFGTRQLVARGKALDVSIMFTPFPEALASGNVVPKSATRLGGLILMVTVRKGAPMPDISTPAAVKRMLLAANSIGVMDPRSGTIGSEGRDVLKNLGVAEQVQAKTKVFANAGLAYASVAKGETDLYLGPQMDGPKIAAGIDAVVVGGVPREVSPVDIVGFVSSSAKDPKAAKALLQFLKSPRAEALYKAAGFWTPKGVSNCASLAEGERTGADVRSRNSASTCGSSSAF